MISRRIFLQGAGAAFAQKPGSLLAYVGSYTDRGEGIYLFRMNTATGALTQLKIFKTPNPSWIAFHPSKRFLYTGSEGSRSGGDTVAAFARETSTGDLKLINSVSVRGSGPAHLSVHPSGKYVFAANYGSGNVAVFPILANGSVGEATDVKADSGACTPLPCPIGAKKPEKAPPGSFAISGHDAPHAHMIESDPAGKFVLVADVGIDRIIVWEFDSANGKLLNPKTVSSSPGAGPRHFAFHPNGRYFYSLNEESSTLDFMLYDAATGSLKPQMEISTLPKGFAGTNFTSELVLSKDGRFAYASNRLHDSIAIFTIGAKGRPTLIGEEWTRGDYPRHINIDPTGSFMYSCNHRGDNITTYRIEKGGQSLRFTGEYTPVGAPAIIVFP